MCPACRPGVVGAERAISTVAAGDEARRYNVFVSVNAIASGRRSRTRDAIGAVRHVFLDADHDGPAVLSRVEARRDLPSPSYILHSSPNHIHVFWRVTGFDQRRRRAAAEAACPRVADGSGGDAGDTEHRLPGFFNHKRAQPHLVTIGYRNVDVTIDRRTFLQSRKRPMVSIGSSAGTLELRYACHRPGKAVSRVRADRDCWSTR